MFSILYKLLIFREFAPEGESARKFSLIFRGRTIIAKTKRAEIENEMSKTSLFSLPFFSCIYWDLNNN